MNSVSELLNYIESLENISPIIKKSFNNTITKSKGSSTIMWLLRYATHFNIWNIKIDNNVFMWIKRESDKDGLNAKQYPKYDLNFKSGNNIGKIFIAYNLLTIQKGGIYSFNRQLLDCSEVQEITRSFFDLKKRNLLKKNKAIDTEARIKAKRESGNDGGIDYITNNFSGDVKTMTLSYTELINLVERQVAVNNRNFEITCYGIKEGLDYLINQPNVCNYTLTIKHSPGGECNDLKLCYRFRFEKIIL
jgi:hypothetical protein